MSETSTADCDFVYSMLSLKNAQNITDMFRIINTYFGLYKMQRCHLSCPWAWAHSLNSSHVRVDALSHTPTPFLSVEGHCPCLSKETPRHLITLLFHRWWTISVQRKPQKTLYCGWYRYSGEDQGRCWQRKNRSIRTCLRRSRGSGPRRIRGPRSVAQCVHMEVD